MNKFQKLTCLTIGFGVFFGVTTFGLAQENGNSLKQKFQANLARAQQGDSNAQLSVGYAHETGKGIGKNLKQAVLWYRKSAEQRNRIAQRNLGLCYEYGRGVNKDLTQAAAWYRKSADQGYARAQYNIAECFKNGKGVTKDESQAAVWFLKAARQGYLSAQSAVADCFWLGTGVEKDFVAARTWYTKAAEQGGPREQLRLAKYLAGSLAFEANEQPTDRAEALKWFLAAANKGHAESIRHLGDFYIDESNFKSAIHWFKKGNEYNSLVFLYEHHYDEVKDMVSEAEACQWKLKGAEDDDYKLGELYASGWRADQGGYYDDPPRPVLIKPDVTKAIQYFEKVANKEETRAMCALGEIYASESGTRRDPNKALQWYLKAAELGSIEAHLVIAESCETGGFVQKNVSQAVEWYLRAMENGSVGSGSYVALRRLFATGKITGMSAGEFEKRFESALKAGLEKGFVTDKVSNRALHDIEEFARLRWPLACPARPTLIAAS